MPPIDFAIEIIHFQPPSYGQPPTSGQRTKKVTPKVQRAVQNSLQEWTEIETSGEKIIKISADSNSAAPRKYIRYFVLSIQYV